MQHDLLLDYRYRASWSCSVTEDERASSVGAVEPRGDLRMNTDTQDATDRAGSSNARDIVEVLVRELGRDERLYVILRYSEGLEIREIASAMRCEEEIVRAGLARVEARIQELVAARTQEPTLSAP